MKINKIRPLEHDFSEVLEKLVLNVKMLYIRGKLPKKCPTVAIVGARKNTSYGYEVAYKAAYEAAKAGAVVVSGLAYGVDSIAHQAALDAGGKTVAVLGTAIDRTYPRAHEGLAREIIDSGGAVISEYGPGSEAKGATGAGVRFLERNRIIAGLSDVVLVVEAADRSGTLNTATHALNFGVDLMVVPGDITRESSRGCNRLLAQGAQVYTGPDDLLDLLFPVRKYKGAKAAKKRLAEQRRRLVAKLETKLEKQIFERILTGVQDGEKIMAELKVSAAEFAQAITVLEVKGVVKSLSMNRWMLRE